MLQTRCQRGNNRNINEDNADNYERTDCCDWLSLRWRHNVRDSVSNHQPRECLLNSLFGADQGKYQSSASLAFVWGIHRGPVNSQHKWPVTRKMFPFDDVIMFTDYFYDANDDNNKNRWARWNDQKDTDVYDKNDNSNHTGYGNK